MNYGGDAAEQVVRMSLEGMEFTLRIAGAGAKNLAAALMVYAKEGQKSMGKIALSNMLKSGKELTVFSLPEQDLKNFTREAKKYGVLYTVIKPHADDEKGIIDIITRAEDAPRINRIVERFRLASVDNVQINRAAERGPSENPTLAGMDRNRLSGRDWQRQKDEIEDSYKKPSVRKKLQQLKKAEKDGGEFRTKRREKEFGKER